MNKRKKAPLRGEVSTQEVGHPMASAQQAWEVMTIDQVFFKGKKRKGYYGFGGLLIPGQKITWMEHNPDSKAVSADKYGGEGLAESRYRGVCQ